MLAQKNGCKQPCGHVKAPDVGGRVNGNQDNDTNKHDTLELMRSATCLILKSEENRL